MEDPNNGESGDRDRLSELPDSLLLFHIFKRLPIKAVVRTSVLSKRYENLWNTVPYLNFHDDCNELISNADIDKFIAWVLMKWRGTKILNLEIESGARIRKSMFGGLDLLLRFAKEYKAEALLLDVDCDAVADMYPPPQCLYSCSSLKRLFISMSDLFHIPVKDVKWDQLETLHINGCNVVSEASIKKVLSGCPRLKVLVLVCVENNENLIIESSSLTTLYICKRVLLIDYEYTSNVHTELRISAPNLETLILEGVPYSKFVMKNAACLGGAFLQFEWHHLLLGNAVVEQTLSQILPVFQHVAALGFSGLCTKLIGEMGKKKMFSPFLNVWCLKLFGCFEEYKETMHLLGQFFPNLTKLILEQRNCSEVFCQHQHGSTELVEFETNIIPNSYLQKLRIIEVIWNEPEDDHAIFPFIEVLVNYSPNVERMLSRVVVVEDEDEDSEDEDEDEEEFFEKEEDEDEEEE